MNFKAVLITAWIWFPALATAYDTESESYLVCKSPECNERATLLKESLNTSIDPCTDFYSYVCDRWESNHSLPGGRNSYDVYDEIRKDIPEMLSYILGNRTWVESSQSIIDKVATMYNACLALPDTNNALIRVLNESGFNSWPILTEGNIFNSTNSTDLLRHMNISTIAHVELSKHPNKRSANPYSIYLKPMPVQEEIGKVSNITVLISNTIKFLNPGMETSLIKNLTNQLVEFSKNLSTAMVDTTLSGSHEISKLDAVCGNKIPVSALLKKEFQKVNITLKDTDKVNVFHIYCKQLSTFLDIADPNTLYNYAGFLALFPYLEYVNISNKSEIKSRNRSQCITLLDQKAPDVLDYLYVANEPNHTAIKTEVKDIARRLIHAFNETLQNNSWVDNKSRQALEKELKELPLQIGYPDALLNMSVLEAFYKYVPYFPSDISFTEAFYYFRENLYKMELRKFRHPEESNWRWVQSLRESRSKFHEKFGMNIEIPYPIFVSPIFQRGLPRSLNYGGIGGVVARTLAYSFSESGIQYINQTYKGFLTQQFSAWFKNKTLCFEEQYKEANLKVLPELSGKRPNVLSQTLNEDLADNTGLLTAFKVYIEVFEEECAGIDTRLAGLESFSGMRLFFISNARTMCKIADKTTLIREISNPRYSPARNRVNMALKNMEEFAKAFNCSLGSPMYPPRNETCSLW